MIKPTQYKKPKNWNKATSLKSITVTFSKYNQRKPKQTLIIFDLMVNAGLKNEFKHLGPAIKETAPDFDFNDVINTYLIKHKIIDKKVLDERGLPINILFQFKPLPNTYKLIVATRPFWDHTKPAKQRRSQAPKTPAKLMVNFIRTFKPSTWDVATSLQSVTFSEYQWAQPHNGRIFHGGKCIINEGLQDQFTLTLATRLHSGEDIRATVADFLRTEGVTTQLIYFNGLDHPEIATKYTVNGILQADLWAQCGSVPLKEWIK
jgi:hypothetical protein